MIDPNKKYRTRDGREVTHLHRAPEGWPSPYPWRGALDGVSDEWSDDGVYILGKDSPEDLVEVREPREWVIRPHSLMAGALVVHSGPTTLANSEMIRVREVLEP